ncbi:3-hydroxyacyl-CoA dehydrogenase family protein [Noviherbaspirillum denitrificans]|uniref:3-hydroxyacyl-CoA dehydrogenase n=1 Tax=Noviherbaspirillum denitrificans TaxID=1968433 RepID=A0A254TEB1_9BURK|nr:3-hydroxyacyl-CoA dehydrogenase family protein [Noviherbaspirillum denitrificans]OWW20991.1 3-hydroxyacyl-CoA dehydrogenase [Noviherbaspirillum denitrificans]
MTYSIIDTGNSRSFPVSHALLEGKSADGDVVILIGDRAGYALSKVEAGSKTAVLVELGSECLGVHTGESRAKEGSNVLGFARFRLGDGDPSNLVELVRQPGTPASAIDAAKAVLEGAGLKVAVCFDFAGRIIDRLVRPYYNAALRRLDEGLATADDMDLTLRLGLGYPEGPIALLERTGLEHHFDVTQSLFEAYGESPYAPARRARVAKARAEKKAD